MTERFFDVSTGSLAVQGSFIVSTLNPLPVSQTVASSYLTNMYMNTPSNMVPPITSTAAMRSQGTRLCRSLGASERQRRLYHRRWRCLCLWTTGGVAPVSVIVVHRRYAVHSFMRYFSVDGSPAMIFSNAYSYQVSASAMPNFSRSKTTCGSGTPSVTMRAPTNGG